MKDVRFVVFHTPGPQWLEGQTLFDQPGVMEHVSHYSKLLEAGKLALGGPHLDADGGGMMIPAAGVTEAEIAAFAAEDPAVKSGVLSFDVRPWLIGMSA
ncbi:YciI family protein [Saccharospirillum alexandrii]|uniref:YciI family protein n=1 Tax=Saccharospirillum alexandrii TaxID=2448477 RepID=UPI0037360060